MAIPFLKLIILPSLNLNLNLELALVTYKKQKLKSLENKRQVIRTFFNILLDYSGTSTINKAKVEFFCLSDVQKVPFFDTLAYRMTGCTHQQKTYMSDLPQNFSILYKNTLNFCHLCHV